MAQEQITRDEAMRLLTEAKKSFAKKIAKYKEDINAVTHEYEAAKRHYHAVTVQAFKDLDEAKSAYYDWCQSAKQAKEIPPAVRRAARLACCSGFSWREAISILGLECRSSNAFNKLTAGYEDLTILDLPAEIRPPRRDFLPDRALVIEWLQNVAKTA